MECAIERRQQSEEEDDGEDTSSSNQDFEDVALREEKALSDSEIKVDIIFTAMTLCVTGVITCHASFYIEFFVIFGLICAV